MCDQPDASWGDDAKKLILAAALATLPPATFETGLEFTPDNPASKAVHPRGVWSILDEPYWVNPVHLVDRDMKDAMMTLYRHWAGGGFGPGHLPQAGGAGDQAAIVMDALGVIGWAVSRLSPRDDGSGPRGTD